MIGDNEGMYAFSAILLFLSLLCSQAHGISKYMLGGYAPFALSMQENSDGSVNPYAFAPSISIGTSIDVEELENDFAPTFGIAFHGSGAGEDYKKSTLYFLMDLEMDWGKSWYFRYGVGFFATFLDGEEGVVERKNGDNAVNFYRPARSVVSYNMALDLGWEYRFAKRWFVRLETFIFSIWDSKARDMSYMLVLGYSRPNSDSLW